MGVVDRASNAIWLDKEGIVNERNEPLTFVNHLFLMHMYNDMSPRQAIKKCAQVGASVMMNLKAYRAAQEWGYNVIYTMPSDSDIYEFVPTKTDKIYNANESIRKTITRDTTSIKGVRSGAFIFFKGTRSKSAPISTTADLIINDEVDRSDLSIVEQYESRVVTSKYKGIWKLSNPSVANAGVDVEWKLSDQKEWFIECAGCNEWQPLTWEDNVDEQKGVYICKFCNKTLTNRERRIGEWVPTAPKSEGISGYHISQMMAPWVTAKELIKQRDEKGVDYFNNFVLGEPSELGEGEDIRQMVMDSWTDDDRVKEPFCLGVDVGRVKHYVLGDANGKIVKTGIFYTREELEGLIRTYNPITVMDAGPERTWADEFRKKYPRFYMCFYKPDKDKKQMIKWFGRKKADMKEFGIVHADRNRVIDRVVWEMSQGNFKFSLSREALEKYIQHWENIHRIVEETRIGTKRYVWTFSTTKRVDHWVHATVYYYIALNRTKEVSYVPEKKQEKNVVEMTDQGPRMRDLKEVLEEQNL